MLRSYRIVNYSLVQQMMFQRQQIRLYHFLMLPHPERYRFVMNNFFFSNDFHQFMFILLLAIKQEMC